MNKEEFIKFYQEIEVGLYNKAKERLFSLLKEDPQDSDILNNLVTLYLNLGNLKIAKKIIKKAKERNNKHEGLKKNAEIIDKVERFGEYSYTFLIFVEKENELIDLWKTWIRSKRLSKRSQYFFLLINPSSYTISLLKKYKIPAIFGKDLIEIINRGFIEKRGGRVIFIPHKLLSSGLKKLLSSEKKFIYFTNKKGEVVAFSIDSSLFSDIGILRKDLGTNASLLDYLHRIDEKEKKEEKIEKDINLESGTPFGISLCMIVKNEEKNIKKVLESVKGLVDEIIVVDTGSQDRTPEMAKEMGAKVFYSEWKDDFSQARNESIRHASFPWILWLDADDYIKEEDKADFLRFKETLKKTNYMAFRMPTLSERKGMFKKKDVNYLTRIFKNHPKIKFEGKIHEQVLFSIARLKGKVGTVNIPIYHTGYEDPEILRKKKERNKKILEKAIEEEPNNPIFLTYLGRTYMEEWFEKGEGIEKAIDLLKRAIKLFPPFEINYLSYAYLNLSLIYYHIQEFKEAMEYARRAIEINKDIESAYEVWGRSLIYMKKFKEAEEVFLKLEKYVDRESPSYIKISDFDYRYFLAISQFNLEKYREAIENFKKVSITQKEEENIDFFIGVAYYKLKEYKEAIIYLKKSIEKNPYHYDSWNNLGNVYLAIGEHKLSEEAYSKALEINQKGEEALFGLGYIYYQTDKFNKAKEYFTELLKLPRIKDPLRDKGYFYLANIYFIEKNYDSAISYLEKIENPQHIGKEYYLLKSNILYVVEEKNRALQVAAEGLTIYDHDINLMKYFAELLEKEGKIPEAISVWEEVLKEEKGNIEVMRKLGLLYAKIGIFQNAILYFEKILDRNPNDVRTHNDLGVFYGLMGNFEKAKIFFKNALKLDPDNKIAKSNLNRIIFEENKENLSHYNS